MNILWCYDHFWAWKNCKVEFSLESSPKHPHMMTPCTQSVSLKYGFQGARTSGWRLVSTPVIRYIFWWLVKMNQSNKLLLHLSVIGFIIDNLTFQAWYLHLDWTTCLAFVLETPALYKLEKLFTGKRVQKDVAKLSSHHQTTSLEAFHSVIIWFVPKTMVIPFLGMLCR